MPETGVVPIPPPDELLYWPAESLSTAPPPDELELVPPPGEPATDGYAYPQAPIYRRNLEPDHRYKRRFAFFSKFDSSMKDIIRTRLLRIKTPPKAAATGYDETTQSFVVEPIPGMTEMLLSVPFADVIDDETLYPTTIATVHNPDSLQQFPGTEEIWPLTKQLFVDSFGCDAAPGRPAAPALWELTGGLKKNDRSPKNLPKGSADGSSSIASTRGDGDGRGIFLPAVQNTSPQAAERIGRILQTLHSIHQIVMPCSMTRFEWEMIRWNSYDNNVFCFGGLGPNGTSCQNNVSSTFNDDLAAAIGAQGSWHCDVGDYMTEVTLCTICLRLPPGSDPGRFQLGRSGLYCTIKRIGDYYVAFLTFKGNNPHTGFSPSINAKVREAWWKTYNALASLYNLVGPQNRCVYVDYGSMAASARLAAMSFSPSLRFLNDGAPLARRAKQLNFATHGDVVLGDFHARANRLGRECAYGFWNGLQYSRLHLTMPIDELLSRVEYIDESGEAHVLDPSPIKMDTEEEYQQVLRWRGYFEFYRRLCMKHYIRITKAQLKAVQGALKLRVAAANKTAVLLPIERRIIMSQHSRDFAAPPSHRVKKVIDHYYTEENKVSVLVVSSKVS